RHALVGSAKLVDECALPQRTVDRFVDLFESVSEVAQRRASGFECRIREAREDACRRADDAPEVFERGDPVLNPLVQSPIGGGFVDPVLEVSAEVVEPLRHARQVLGTLTGPSAQRTWATG